MEIGSLPWWNGFRNRPAQVLINAAIAIQLQNCRGSRDGEFLLPATQGSRHPARPREQMERNAAVSLNTL
jgi:hypothetical protein